MWKVKSYAYVAEAADRAVALIARASIVGGLPRNSNLLYAFKPVVTPLPRDPWTRFPRFCQNSSSVGLGRILLMWR
jgi:hypothetical protein